MDERTEIYVSTDVETDGPIPGDYSMIAIGSAAYDAAGKLLATFMSNLTPLPGASVNAGTKAFYDRAGAGLWERLHQNQDDPEGIMRDYARWLGDLDERPIFVGYPAAFDFMFVQWYLQHFTGTQPFSFSALDIKTLAMEALSGPGAEQRLYRDSIKQKMPRAWFDPALKHTHDPLDDALEQGHLFFSIRGVLQRRREELTKL